MRRPTPRALLVIGAVLAAGLGLALAFLPGEPREDERPPSHAAAVRCDVVAAPTGSDSAPGTSARPLRTVPRLLRRLRAGLTGCLRAGRYEWRGELLVPRGGRPGAPVTLTSWPGERATLAGGMLTVPTRAHDLVLSGLDIDGSGHRDVTVWVLADRVVLEDDVITNRNVGASCVLLGSGLPDGGYSDGAIVRRNRILECGRPGSNRDHGVYASEARDARIVDNVIARTAGYGVQLYPRAERVRVAQNTILDTYGGVILGGDRSGASSYNQIMRNVIADAREDYLVQSYWEGPEGTGNVVARNCLHRGRMGTVWGSGFDARENVTADPGFVDAARGDFRLRSGSRCLAVLGSPPAPGATAGVTAAR